MINLLYVCLRHLFILFSLSSILLISPTLAANVSDSTIKSSEAPKSLNVVASFSIIEDMVKAIGGDRINITTLIGPNSDSHAYQPTPKDARNLVNTSLFFVNGLGFEAWLERLVEASGYQGKQVVVTQGITPLVFSGAQSSAHHDEHETAHEENAEHASNDEHGHKHDHGSTDPHAWQSLKHAEIYISNITAALQQADKKNADFYAKNQEKYLKQLRALENRAQQLFADLPTDQRSIVTAHQAFGYLGEAYGLRFLAPQGLNSASEATAKDVAALIRQIRSENIQAVFLENNINPKLIKQIADEGAVSIGGTLYAGTLSEPDGEAGTYLKMMQHNIESIYNALSRASKAD